MFLFLFWLSRLLIGADREILLAIKVGAMLSSDDVSTHAGSQESHC